MDSDTKKEAMLEELKVAVKDQREKLDRERESLYKEKD